MRARCEALLLEDDPAHMAGLAAMIRRLHLLPIPTRTPDQALRRLDYYHPVLAVLDLDMSLAPESQRAVADVLHRLYDDCGGCFVLVYSASADEIAVRKGIEAIHPLATFVSKHDGLAVLAERVRRMMGVRFGDLVARRGVTLHEPSGRTFGHRVAVSLLLGTALGHEVLLDDVEAKAARRLRAWLHDVGSCVVLVDHGHRCYALHVVHRYAEQQVGPGLLAV